MTTCTLFSWSPTALDALTPIIITKSIAVVTHTLFWIQFLVCSSLRQRNMMWLYVYLITDFLLILRFFILYGIRLSSVCLYPIGRDILCYFEASSKFYLNTVQSYLLLAFNGCRYLHVVSNRNIYREKPRLVIVIHIIIYFLPAINIIVPFLTKWSSIWRRRGGSCDIVYSSLIVQIFNLCVVYIIPIVLNIFILGFGIRHVSSIRNVRNEQIILLRRKRQRILLFQTIAFYSVWLLLWSPDILTFQFLNANSDPAVFTTLLSVIEIALDPAMLGIIDVRFLTTWRKLWNKIKRRRQIGVVS
ncbi:hypothetical protein I4U23_030530 [Adineta vaga]|nr:hypothetical protein I4U23_030530 [Adineta vaga]